MVLAVIAAGVAACLALPVRDLGPAGRARRPGQGARRGVFVVLALVAAALPGLSVLPATTVVLGVVLVGLVGAGVRLLAARRRQRAASAARARVLDVCEQLASELGAGQPIGQALERAGRDWAPLRPVVEAFRIGADVPTELRRLAQGDQAQGDQGQGEGGEGLADLRLLAAAWQVAHRSGQGLAAAVDRVATDIRAAHATQRIVEGELASARATARLVSALPVVALGMGSGAGGDPWGFLLGTAGGVACLALGLAFAVAGLAWIEAIARGVHTG